MGAGSLDAEWASDSPHSTEPSVYRPEQALDVHSLTVFEQASSTRQSRRVAGEHACVAGIWPISNVLWPGANSDGVAPNSTTVTSGTAPTLVDSLTCPTAGLPRRVWSSGLAGRL